MAIGDMIYAYLGTAEENYQPTSGVEVQVGFFTKNGTNGTLSSYDGTDTIPVMAAAGRGDTDTSLTRNVAWMISNAAYVRKTTTSDMVVITGVITNV